MDAKADKKTTTPTRYKQNTPWPTTKVALGGIAGAISTLLVFAINSYQILPNGAQITPEIASALTTLISLAVAYFVSPSINDQVVES